jgi:tRNA-modifying protein YgfZ
MDHGRTLLFYRSEKQGRLEFTGRDRLDLLHRMSTNDVQNLQPGQGRSTVLTTALARIIDRVIVYHRPDTTLVVANQPETVRAWLQKHIFFRDQVKIRDMSATLGQLELHGPLAAEVARTIAPVVADQELHHFVELPGGTLLARTFPLLDDGYVLIGPAEALSELPTKILKHDGVAPGTDADYELLRIEAGLPGPGHELTEDFIPLEANLWDSVSFTKGCYIGQEIIARMESRNRLAKTLVSLRLSAPVPDGTTLSDGDRNVGTLTSVAQRDDGTVLGLGFVKPDQAAPGMQLKALAADASPVAVEVTEAPLIAARR